MIYGLHAAERSMVAMKRHFWVSLADSKEMEKNVLLDVPILPSDLFITKVETVLRTFWEAKVHFMTFKTFIPHQSRPKPVCPELGA